MRLLARRSPTSFTSSHRDEVESPITDWLAEAYDTSDTLSGQGGLSPNPG